MTPADTGRDLYGLIERLYPICRSITGNGVRETLAIVKEHIPLEVHEVPSGTPVLDWTVPREWNVRDAWVKDSRGRRVIDFRRSNLHVLGYSVPVRRRVSLSELREHLFTLPERPDWIPYRTSYYRDAWGFCLSHSDAAALHEDEYEVCIDTSLEDGHLTYGECHLPGETTDEVLLSCHVCHPSLCNDNLSGIALLTLLAAHLGGLRRRYSYRFLFIPGTIGSITWLARNEDLTGRIRHGLVVANVGDRGGLTYKRSRRGRADVDRAAAHVLRHSGEPWEVLDFEPWGYDERQFCSPGFDLPVGCLSRTPHGRFPEYHTSADNLDFVDPASLGRSFTTCLAILEVLEGNARYLNLSPRGEPQLGRRGLYRAVGGAPEGRAAEMALLWVLNLSDGQHTLLDIAERSGMPFQLLRHAAARLLERGLLGPEGEPVRHE